MPNKKFTARFIESVKPPRSGRIDYWDTANPMFGLRVSDRGTKSWIVMYRVNGRLRRHTLGRFPGLGLADARKEALKTQTKARDGEDAGAQKQSSRKAETFDDLAKVYMADHGSKQRSGAVMQRLLDKDILPEIGQWKAAKIAKRDIKAVYNKAIDRDAPIQANRLFQLMRSVFNHGVREEILSASPMAKMRLPSEESSRERVLSADEIKSFWNGLDKAKMSPEIRLTLRLQLVTGQRKGEVIGINRSEIDRKEKVWNLPAERSKNKRSHQIPLTKLALEIIKDAERLADAPPKDEKKAKSKTKKTEWLFPSPRGGKPMGPTSVNHVLNDNLKVLGLKDVTPHDLRRTAASHMASMGVSRQVIGRILNHSQRGEITAVYDRHSYLPEMRTALDAWAIRLDDIVSGKNPGNVVPLIPRAS